MLITNWELNLPAFICAPYSGSGQAAKLPCGSHSRRRAGASPSVLHPHQLWKCGSTGDGVHGGLERTPLGEVCTLAPTSPTHAFHFNHLLFVISHQPWLNGCSHSADHGNYFEAFQFIFNISTYLKWVPCLHLQKVVSRTGWIAAAKRKTLSGNGKQYLPLQIKLFV